MKVEMSRNWDLEESLAYRLYKFQIRKLGSGVALRPEFFACKLVK